MSRMSLVVMLLLALVQGCASRVWLQTTRRIEADGVHLDLVGDSDALIVRGLVALAIAIFSGPPR